MRSHSVWGHPALWLAIAVAALLSSLSLRLTLPIGSYYWDLAVYLDGADRILAGQIPMVDFMAPAGPLAYALFAALYNLFPGAQPLLTAQWSMLVVTLPLMLDVLIDVDRRSRMTAVALLVPFLIFAALPYNDYSYFLYPGADGAGIYNRHSIHLLYCLTAALLFVADGRRLVAIMAAAMTALFLTKITGFLAGVILCTLALAAGRITLRQSLIGAALCVGVLAVLEAASGIVSAYVIELEELAALNDHEIVSRILRMASMQFDVIGPAVLLAAWLAAIDRHRVLNRFRGTDWRRRFAALRRVCDHDAVWICVAVAAGILFESQNTGSQAFGFLWPILLRLFLSIARRPDLGILAARVAIVLSIVAATSTIFGVVERAVRGSVAQAFYADMAFPGLKRLGAVSAHHATIERAEIMRDIYARHPETYRAIVEAGTRSSFTLYAEPDFQLVWLATLREAIEAIRTYEARHGVRFERIMNANFVNPFPWLLDRTPIEHLSVGASPGRTLPPLDAEHRRIVSKADIVLVPRCPTSEIGEQVLDVYRPALVDHRMITLSPCWDALVRSALLPPPRGTELPDAAMRQSTILLPDTVEPRVVAMQASAIVE